MVYANLNDKLLSLVFVMIFIFKTKQEEIHRNFKTIFQQLNYFNLRIQYKTQKKNMSKVLIKSK